MAGRVRTAVSTFGREGRPGNAFYPCNRGARRAKRPLPRPSRAIDTYARARPPQVRRPPRLRAKAVSGEAIRSGLGGEPRGGAARRRAVFGGAMPEVFFNGPAGRLEGRFHPAKQRGAPIAVVLHPHPQFGGTMNNQIVYNTYYSLRRARLLGAALQFPRRRPLAGRVRPRPGRVVGRGLARSTGRSRSARRRAPAGSPASRSAPGSACNC